MRLPAFAALLSLGCAHAPSGQSQDVLSVTELVARHALEHDVPPVLREPSGICLEVDGQPPAPEVLSRLSAGPRQVSAGPWGCTGPRPVLVQVSGVVVTGHTATARAGVFEGRSGPLTLRKVDGQWQVLRPPGPLDNGPRLSVPLSP